MSKKKQDATIKLPKSVMIGSQIYRVELTTLSESDGGEFTVEPRRIRIDPEYQTPHSMLLTYFHEGFHGVEEEWGVKFSDKDIDRIAQGAVQLTLALVAAQ